jgi:hypothetical protein
MSFVDEINGSVMIQKLDKKALAVRLFGKDTDDPEETENGGDVEKDTRQEEEEG